MEEDKIQRLHDTLSKLRKSAGLGISSQFQFGNNVINDSIPTKLDKAGKLIREDGLPVNSLYSNFLKQGTYDPTKKNQYDAAKYGDGRFIKRNFDDCNGSDDYEENDTASKKKKRNTDEDKERRKSEKKAAKLEAKRKAKLEEKKRAKLEAKKLARQSSSIDKDTDTTVATTTTSTSTSSNMGQIVDTSTNDSKGEMQYYEHNSIKEKKKSKKKKISRNSKDDKDGESKKEKKKKSKKLKEN